MRTKRIDALFCVTIVFGIGVVGCSGPTMSKAEIDAAFKSKPPTDAQRRQMAAGMSAGFEAAKQQELDWAKAHPDKVASVNAARAAAGKPPLGQ